MEQIHLHLRCNMPRIKIYHQLFWISLFQMALTSTTTSTTTARTSDSTQTNNHEFVVYLLEHDSKTRYPIFLAHYPPLACAARQSSLDTAKILIQYGACSTTAVPEAATGRRLDMLKILQDNGADVNDSSGSFSPDNMTRKFTALHIAAYLRYENVAELFLPKGADK